MFLKRHVFGRSGYTLPAAGAAVLDKLEGDPYIRRIYLREVWSHPVSGCDFRDQFTVRCMYKLRLHYW